MTANLFTTVLAFMSLAAAVDAEKPPATADARPTLFLIGDSTVNNSSKGLLGWGKPIVAEFDAAKIRVENRARGGRSSRTFYTEGLWGQVAAQLKPGDFVLMQFGHNDGGSLRQSTRASLKGTGDATEEWTDPKTGKKETVRTYGWYLRSYVKEAKAKGATPIVLSPVPRNIWKEGHVGRASGDYGKWAAEVAKSESVPFVDLNEIVAKQYETAGEEKVKTAYFSPTDHTHTTPEGAKLNAKSVVEGVRGLADCRLNDYVGKK